MEITFRKVPAYILCNFYDLMFSFPTALMNYRLLQIGSSPGLTFRGYSDGFGNGSCCEGSQFYRLKDIAFPPSK